MNKIWGWQDRYCKIKIIRLLRFWKILQISYFLLKMCPVVFVLGMENKFHHKWQDEWDSHSVNETTQRSNVINLAFIFKIHVISLVCSLIVLIHLLLSKFLKSHTLIVWLHDDFQCLLLHHLNNIIWSRLSGQLTFLPLYIHIRVCALVIL